MNKTLKLFVITNILILLLGVGIVSAWEWDNVKQYEEASQTITIKNSFIGLFPLGDVASIKLDTPQHNIVRAGKDKLVAQMTINNLEIDYPSFLKGLEFYDINDRMTQFSRDYRIKYAVQVTRYRNITSAVCPNPNVIKDCHTEITRFNEEYLDIEWRDLDTTKDLPKGKMTIGIFTDVYEGDYVEWVVEMFGLRLTEWTDFAGSSAIEWAYPTIDSARGIQNSELVRQNFTIGYSSSNATYNMVGITIGISQKSPSTCSAGETFNVKLLNAAYDTTIAQNVSIPCSVITSTNYLTPDFYNVTISATLSPNTQYFIEISKNDVNDLLMWIPNQLATSVYDGGNYAQYSGAWTNYGEDAWFEVWGTELILPTDYNLTASLRSPNNLLNTTNTTIVFEGNFSTLNTNLTNATLYVWDGSHSLNYTNETVINADVNVSYDANWTVGTFTNGSWYWNIYACATNVSKTFCLFPETNRSFIVDSTAPAIEITYPPNSVIDYWKAGNNMTFNWTVSNSGPAQIDACKYYYNHSNLTTTSCYDNTTLVSVDSFWNRSLIFYINDTFGNSNFNTTNWTYKVFEVNQTFTGVAFEGATEEFFAEFYTYSPITHVEFYYNNTNYTALFTGNSTNRSLLLPTESGEFEFFWSLDLTDGTQINTTSMNQTVSDLNLSLCSATNNVPYINFSFKNETVGQENSKALISTGLVTYWLSTSSSNLTYTFTNPTELNAYTFCLNPPDKTIFTDWYIGYDNAESEQRIFQNTLTLTNGTTNQTLWLLPTSDGIFVTFQVLSQSDSPLSNVKLTLVRSGYGTISTTYTGASGTSTVFLNPNFQYTLTAERAGFQTFNSTQAFTTTEYTIVLGESNLIADDYIKGIRVKTRPYAGGLLNGTVYEFNYTLVSEYWALDGYGFTLKNSSGTMLGSNSSMANGGFLNYFLNTHNQTYIIMDYYWIINGSTLNYTVSWYVSPFEGGSIYGFFAKLKMYVSDGIFGLNAFSLALITFTFIFLLVGVLSYNFGLTSPIIIFTIATICVIFIDIVDIFNTNGIPSGIMIIILFIMYLLGVDR